MLAPLCFSSSTAWHTLLAVLLFTRLTVGTPAPQKGLGTRQSDANTSWQQYVRAPSSKTITPVAYLAAYSTGNITNPGGIVDGGDDSGVTTLTRNDDSEDMPSLVLDFGQNYVGILSINFAGAETFSDSSNKSTPAPLPGITLAFSESLEFLTNRSDFTRSDNLPADAKLTNGTDQIAVPHATSTWTAQLGCQHSGKVCADGLHGFRYLRITLQALASDAPYTAPHGSVSLTSLSLSLSAFLGTPETFTGWFECSDAALTQWWFDAVYTADLCTDTFRANDSDPRDAADASNTMLDKLVLHDGAKRDRDPYVGDLAVSALTVYLSHLSNAPAARNVLSDLALHQRAADGWIPPASINNYTLPLYDYPLWWVVCSADLVLYTGDVAYLDEFYAVMVRVLDEYYPGSTNAVGLLEKGLGTSEGYGDYAFLPRSGVVSYYNALYVLALGRAAVVAGFRGEEGDAARWRARADAVGAALLLENWDPSVSALYDGGPCPTDTTTTNTNTNTSTKCAVHAQDGNSLAILAGITTTPTALTLSPNPDAAILAYLSSALARPYGNAFYDVSTLDPSAQFDQRVYAFISYFELAARFQTAQREIGNGSEGGVVQQMAASAFEQLRRTYGHMASRDPGGTFWEGVGPSGENGYYEAGYTSLAHAWSTGVVALMTNYVLGAVPTGIGWATFDVKPVTVGGGLAFARGVVGVPGDGKVGIAWTVGDVDTGAGLRLTVEVPAGCVGTVFVPVLGWDSVVRRDGEVVWEGGSGAVVDGVRIEGGYVVVVVEGVGTAVFTTGTS